MDSQLGTIPSLRQGGGGGGGNGDGTQHGRLYSYHTDTIRTSSTSTSTHELSDKAWDLKNAPSGNGTINRVLPPPSQLPPRRVVNKKNRWVRIAQHLFACQRASPPARQPTSPFAI